jgi:predicted HAD superfamily phosphohydrolase
MQESMITFSVFLQDNERKKHKAEERKNAEKALNQQREEEYIAMKSKLQFIEQKANRIMLKKNALTKYENYLDRVRQSSDEFSEIKDILDRYDTLCKENEKLDSTHRGLEDRLKDMKDSTTKYIKDKSTEIMKLNNDISTKKTELEKIIDE